MPKFTEHVKCYIYRETLGERCVFGESLVRLHSALRFNRTGRFHIEIAHTLHCHADNKLLEYSQCLLSEWIT